MELNLNTVQRQTLDLTMMDTDQTTLHVKIPTRDMYREMLSMATALDKVEDGDKDSIEFLYDFVARALSCNREHIRITPDEMMPEGKYHMDLEDVLLVFGAYVDFITTVTNVKN